MSCGAALLNARLAIRAGGGEPQVRLLPHPEYPFTVLALIRIAAGQPPTAADLELFEAIPARHTNRGPYAERSVPPQVHEALREAARAEGAQFQMLGRDQATKALVAAAEAGRELARDADHHHELERWIGNGRDDGIPPAAMPQLPDRSPAPVRTDDFLAAAAAAAQSGNAVSYEQFPQLAVLTTREDEPADWLIAGQALQRVLLAATANGLSASFLYQLIELCDMREDDLPCWLGPARMQMIMRLGYAKAAAVPVPRRQQDDVLAPGRSTARGSAA